MLVSMNICFLPILDLCYHSLVTLVLSFSSENRTVTSDRKIAVEKHFYLPGPFMSFYLKINKKKKCKKNGQNNLFHFCVGLKHNLRNSNAEANSK